MFDRGSALHQTKAASEGRVTAAGGVLCLQQRRPIAKKSSPCSPVTRCHVRLTAEACRRGDRLPGAG